MSVKFPTIMYKIGGPHRGPKGVFCDHLGVNDKKTYDEAVKNGWRTDLNKIVDMYLNKEEEKPTGKDYSKEDIINKDGEKLLLGKSKINRKTDFKGKKKEVKVEEETDNVVD